MQKLVKDFHVATGQIVNDSPVIPSRELMNLRYRLIKEELDELSMAIDNDDLVEIADALGDILYLVYGTGVVTGIYLKPVFEEIHNSNMTKVMPNGDIRLREDGKILKPEGYRPPDLVSVIEKQCQTK